RQDRCRRLASARTARADMKPGGVYDLLDALNVIQAEDAKENGAGRLTEPARMGRHTAEVIRREVIAKKRRAPARMALNVEQVGRVSIDLVRQICAGRLRDRPERLRSVAPV